MAIEAISDNDKNEFVRIFNRLKPLIKLYNVQVEKDVPAPAPASATSLPLKTSYSPVQARAVQDCLDYSDGDVYLFARALENMKLHTIK